MGDLSNKVDTHDPFCRKHFLAGKGELCFYFPTTITDEDGEVLWEEVERDLRLGLHALARQLRDRYDAVVTIPKYRGEG